MRQQILNQIADLIVQVDVSHVTRVAIDGVDASGKTTLAAELTPLIEERGRPTLRASIDGFHRPRAERYQQGQDSPEGYYQDAFDYQAIRDSLLVPLGPDGDNCYRSAVFDYRTDSPLSEPLREAPVGAVLLFDGVFLMRPELSDCWDFRIFVEADFEETVRRACRRDLSLFGSAEATLERYKKRYIPGQQFYLQTVQPQKLADVVIINTDVGNPSIRIRAAGQVRTGLFVLRD